MTSAPHLAFYVQQLLGTGHVHRTSALVRALTAAGVRVTVLLGGGGDDRARYGDVAVRVLPGIRASDIAFAGLIDDHGAPVTSAYWQQRQAMLQGFLADDGPDAIMTELFPFGRRAFAPEIIEFLAKFRQQRPDGPIYCSLRDIIVPPQKTNRLTQSFDWARQWFDTILVHTDPAVMPLSASLDLPPDLATRAVPTGYVVEQKSPVPLVSSFDRPPIVVASGGGAVGAAMMDVALTLRQRGFMADDPWLFLVGRHLPAATAARLKQAHDPAHQIYVEPNRPDYRALLQQSRLSVSQGGYNTLMDLVSIGCRGVVVPFVGAGETEQALRARVFADYGWVWMLPEQDLSPDGLAAIMAQALNHPTHLPEPPRIDLGGADFTARWVADHLAQS